MRKNSKCKYIKIYHKNKIYKIKEENLIYIISILSSEAIEAGCDYEKYFNEFGLYNKIFLKNINKLIKK